MPLQVCETFASILGESTYVGLPAFFIRLSGCNLRCAYCDTTYAYGGGETRSIPSLVAEAQAADLPHVLVTGGEPLLQDECPDLLRTLADAGFTVLLETNGSRPVHHLDPRVRRIVDLKCPSSGMAAHNYLPNLQVLTATDELKCVVQDAQDFAWALDLLRPRQSWTRHPVLFSPVFGVLPPADLAAWIIASRLPLRLNLQMHKYIWSPEARGV